MFGDLLRDYRVRAGLSQDELAERARLSLSAVSALERGVRRSPHLHTVSLLAKALALTDIERATLEAARERNRAWPSQIDSVSNLPAHRTSFVGRNEEIAEIVQLLEKSRLVTVTGFGGIGKTRAAIEVAGVLLGSTWNEVWFVDLAAVTDESFIAAKIASSIQPPLAGRAETVSTLASALSNRRLLLVLDNCEHLVDGVAKAVGVLLETCPRIAILATSREPLNLEGEAVHRLRALSLPVDMPSSLEDASSYSAIDLFVQRAEALDQHLVLDAKNLGAIVNISHRLSGIPLAIELVATQASVLGLRTIEARLDELFAAPLGRRDLPPRQLTVSSAIKWSYELLTAREQSFLCDVSVFVGGFSIEAAEIVCRRDLANEHSILSELSSLVNKSLITLNQAQDGDRYLLLDSVRVFGLERLRENGELAPALRRHARWLSDIADRIDYNSLEEPAGPIIKVLPELDNVRAAIAWALNSEDSDDRSLAGHILKGFFALWRLTGRLREHQKWIEAALERIDAERHASIVAQLFLESIAITTYKPEVLSTIDRAIPLFDRLGDRRASATLHSLLVDAFARHERYEEAERSSNIAEALIIEENMTESKLYATFLANRAVLNLKRARYDEVRVDLAAAKVLALSLGLRSIAAHCAVRSMAVEYYAGNVRVALDLAEKFMGGELSSIAVVTRDVVEMAANFQLQLGELDQAAVNIRRLDRTFTDVGYDHPCRYAAALAALRGDPLKAAKLLGYVRAHEEHCEDLSPIRQSTREILNASLHRQLDDEAIAIAEAEGARWTEETAFAEIAAVASSQAAAK